LVEGVVGGTDSIVVSSVQCEIGRNVNHIFDPEGGESYLHAAGREDIDVRMLGTGRPFIFEFINPRNAISCLDMVKDIKFESPYVACRDFKIVNKEFFDHLKEIES
jgi:tRNA pseudouridine synthase 10